MVVKKKPSRLPPAEHRPETPWPPVGEIEIAFANSRVGRGESGTSFNHTVSIALPPILAGYLFRAIGADSMGLEHCELKTGAKRGAYALVRLGGVNEVTYLQRYIAVLEPKEGEDRSQWRDYRRGFKAMLGALEHIKSGWALVRQADVERIRAVLDQVPPVPNPKDLKAKRLTEAVTRLINAET